MLIKGSSLPLRLSLLSSLVRSIGVCFCCLTAAIAALVTGLLNANSAVESVLSDGFIGRQSLHPRMERNGSAAWLVDFAAVKTVSC